VLAPIHHPLHVAARMATLDILSHGRVDVGLGRTAIPTVDALWLRPRRHARMWLEFADMLPKIWTQEEFSYNGTYFKTPLREVLPKPLQRPHPPLWSACGSDETARLSGSLGMGGLFGSEAGPDRVGQLLGIYNDALATAPNAVGMPRRATLMTAGFCHEDRNVIASRGTELVAWYIEQQRERARLVWRDYDPALCRRTTRATTPATSTLPPARIPASRRRKPCRRTARHSVSARQTNASASWNCTRRWESRRSSCCVPSGRPSMRKCSTRCACLASTSSRISGEGDTALIFQVRTPAPTSDVELPAMESTN